MDMPSSPDIEEAPHATLFAAIEREDERAIADILRRIVMAAREDGWNAEDIIRFLREKGIEPGGNLRGWIHYQIAALDGAGAAPKK